MDAGENTLGQLIRAHGRAGAIAEVLPMHPRESPGRGEGNRRPGVACKQGEGREPGRQSRATRVAKVPKGGDTRARVTLQRGTGEEKKTASEEMEELSGKGEGRTLRVEHDRC